MDTATLFGMFPFLKTLFADSGYQGPKFAKALTKVLPHLDTEIVKRSDQVSGFAVLPKRWIVERTIAWLNRCRRFGQRLGVPQPKRPWRSCALPQSAHAQKTLQSGLNSPDRTLRYF
jgi:transposase